MRLILRPDILHVLALGLSAQWERRGDELWLRSTFLPPKLERWLALGAVVGSILFTVAWIVPGPARPGTVQAR